MRLLPKFMLALVCLMFAIATIAFMQGKLFVILIVTIFLLAFPYPPWIIPNMDPKEKRLLTLVFFSVAISVQVLAMIGFFFLLKQGTFN